MIAPSPAQTRLKASSINVRGPSRSSSSIEFIPFVYYKGKILGIPPDVNFHGCRYPAGIETDNIFMEASYGSVA
jgi:hypothetical protein